jgi:hypothetical protein
MIMRPVFLAAAVLAAAALLPVQASAFELDSPNAAGGLGAQNFDIDIDGAGPQAGTVFERFADSDDKNKPGTLQVFGNDLGGTYGIPNTIPGPPNQTPTWFYSTPSFRASR